MGGLKHVNAWKKKYGKKDEKIVAWSDGYIGKQMGKGKDQQHNGALVVTNMRVAFYRKGFFGEVHQTIPIPKITSVEQRSQLGWHALKMHTSNDFLEFKTFNKFRYATLVEALEDGRSAEEASAAETERPSSDDPLEALKKLGELRAAGVVSEEEFETKKAELLARV